MAIDWRSLLASEDGIRLEAAATRHDLAKVEAAISVPLPDELRSLYLATNGVWDEPGQWFVVWRLADVETENLDRARNGHVDSGLIAFGDDGGAGLFCVRPGVGAAVFYWSPIDAQSTLLASNLTSFWHGWSSRTLPAH